MAVLKDKKIDPESTYWIHLRTRVGNDTIFMEFYGGGTLVKPMVRDAKSRHFCPSLG
jgi:hypothetical protein